jgi:hypothetical protein
LTTTFWQRQNPPMVVVKIPPTWRYCIRHRKCSLLVINMQVSVVILI